MNNKEIHEYLVFKDIILIDIFHKNLCLPESIINRLEGLEITRKGTTIRYTGTVDSYGLDYAIIK